MVNNVVLVGRITKEPELKYTSSGIATVKFTLAVNRQFKNQAGEREADFIRCVIWRQAAENFANWAKKGALIGVTGRIQTGSYDNNQGQRVYTTDVVVENFQMLESRSQSESQQAPQQNNTYQQPKPTQQNNNFGTAPIEISDDDLPF
ncbi:MULTISPECIES: single-stranded DNA-binding protein [unclassified Enterococcus]|uniref:single-stranded DNA-binding protein n=1 Tax=unclassified Enterococcus TaxID=2608891 RepID=UPI001556EDDC|nr:MULTISPECIES: single-stranded DNA-binding protein [unclassified Enterococcus]MBS7578320.1 single-stranded DNA-binding protein [Enterococcus sp. MMGLQ5-2]MBS7585469.1 single-stranded DNA-binding protein [Enterococcus sp. MMGLQ5-1]NPD13326.1 single-stranded DNA-binding protein [Enterococcus sp. MMGLQ5-1]NPD38151.1 single-stranded DNA-binding protein [Enterococcus sp. MMGLQ5-2]